MRELQLYIGNQRIELFKDEAITITQSIQNIKDIEKIFTTFSKTFSIPASEQNNKIFKHFYRYDISNGFDARLKVDASLDINNLPFKKGKIKLEGVDIKNRKPYSYRITFFGNAVELKDLLGDDKLNNLDLSAYNRTYSSSSVKSALQNSITSTTHVVAPLITHTQRLYYDSGDTDSDTGNLYFTSGGARGVRWDNLKYALRINKIIEAIEDRYSTPSFETNLSFSTDLFKNTTKPFFNNLFMWLHRKSGDVENLSGNTTVVTQIQNWGQWTNSASTGSPSNYGYFTTGIGFFFGTSPAGIFGGRTEQLVINLPSTETDDYRIRLINVTSGSIVAFDSGVVNGSQTFNINYLLGQNQFIIAEIEANAPISVNYIRIVATYTQSFPLTFWIFTIETTAGFTTGSQFQFNAAQQIPDIKTIEFLTGLFKMFNLTAYVDETYPQIDDLGNPTSNTRIVVQPLDEYYATYKSYDITEFVDVNKQVVNVALPYRRISFKYKDTKTFLANRYKQLANIDWGETSYTTGETNLAGGLYKIELPFSHMQFERLNDANNGNLKDIMYGYSVNESQNPYKGDPLLFYPIRQNTGGISFVEDFTASGDFGNTSIVTNAILPSNSVSLNPAVNQRNIHFQLEVNEWTRNTLFDRTLFSEFYSEYIQSVFNPVRRLVKLTAYLPLNIFTKIQLNDRIIYAGNEYRINTMTTNIMTGKTDFELINFQQPVA